MTGNSAEKVNINALHTYILAVLKMAKNLDMEF
jgi:hypothetical protein